MNTITTVRKPNQFLFFTGQGCQRLAQNSEMDRGWNELFKLVPMPMHASLQESAHHKALKIRGNDMTMANVDPSIVFGHSAGAVIATMVAAELKRVKTLVLIAPAPMPGMRIPSHLQLKMMANIHYWVSAFSNQDFELDEEDAKHLMLNRMDDGEQKRALAGMDLWSGKIVNEMFWSQFSWSTTEKLREKLKGKSIIVVGGENDQMIPTDYSRKVAASLVGQHYEFAGAQHMLMLGKDSRHYLHELERLMSQVPDFVRAMSGKKFGVQKPRPMAPFH